MTTDKEQTEVYEWQKKKIRERLKNSERGSKYLTSDQVNQIVESFKPGSLSKEIKEP